MVPAGADAFLLAIADVSGKGVPAALLSSMLQASLRTQAGTERSTAAILASINRLICESTSRQQFATFFLALVDEPAHAHVHERRAQSPAAAARGRGAAPARGGRLGGGHARLRDVRRGDRAARAGDRCCSTPTA